MLDIYLRNCKWCLGKWGRCYTYCQQLYFRPNLDKWFFIILDSHGKDENDNLSSSGTAGLLKFDRLHSLENYLRFDYCNIFSPTLYFQVQFIKVQCIAIAKGVIKYELKRERLSARREKDLLAKKKKILWRSWKGNTGT